MGQKAKPTDMIGMSDLSLASRQVSFAPNCDIVFHPLTSRSKREQPIIVHHSGRTNNWLEAACADRPERLD
jgi:hypothetical protein